MLTLEITIVLVEPKYDGNIGSTARAMKNFGFSDLVLINPPPLEKECYQRAMHAVDILENVKTYKRLEEYLPTAQIVIGTSGIQNINEKAHLRNPIEPRELVEKIAGTDENIAILFGREDYGLYREELAACDMLVTIPTNPDYPIMNISHAVAVILYELSIVELNVPKARGMNKVEKEKFFEMFDNLLLAIDYPDYKYENTKVLFRRLIGRAVPSKWEFAVLMGILSKAKEYSETSPLKKKKA